MQIQIKRKLEYIIWLAGLFTVTGFTLLVLAVAVIWCIGFIGRHW